MHYINRKHVLLSATAMTLGWSAPTLAQEADSEASANDIIVTAQRVEQRLQDVPISITVLDQAKLSNNNVQNLKDIASFTPGLAVNNRYGSDSTTFTIRGFYQEQRSFATVGVFFADVVAPRGSGATFGGDGAGPGQLFDLQNVQVLKGPQGTLFGRNVTGGAVLLVPRKPTDRFEGYVEGSAGNFDMYRAQAVLNIPLADTFRVRLGVDRLKRDGYLKNVGNFGDGTQGNHGLGDTDYYTVRLSAVADLTPDLENYMIATYSHSQSNGVIPKIVASFRPSTDPTCSRVTVANFGCESEAQIAREAPFGFWSVSNRLPDSQSITDTWQVINTTTWTASDSLTIKNILSYGEFRGKTNLDLFGNYALLPGAVFGSETPSQVNGFAFTHNVGAFGRTNAQSSFIEELQFQGHPGDGRFTWQAGAYVEINDPLGFSGVQTASFTPCTDIASFNCLATNFAVGSVGTGSYSIQKTKFRDYAAYAQASYELTEQLKFTAGIRYTWDKMRTFLINETSLFGTPGNADTVRFRCSNVTAAEYSGSSTYPYTFAERLGVCQQNLRQDTEAPTWLLGVDFKPMENILLYAKWSRGYRQGGLAIFGPDPIQPYDKESVDTYEVGAKTSWRGSFPGSFNISAYYNDFSNQQLQLGVSCVPGAPGFTIPCAGNAAIINAGKSRMYGLEADLNISPFEGMRIDVAYGYLNARQKEVTIPAPGTLPPYNVFTSPQVAPCLGEQCDTIANSGPPHQVVASANYTLPLPDSIGRFSVGGTFVYQSRRRIVADGIVGSGAGVAPSSSVLNLNATWQDVAQLPVDLSFFMTNVTNEHVILQINDNTARGFIAATVGEPRTWGFRLKYRFND